VNERGGLELEFKHAHKRNINTSITAALNVYRFMLTKPELFSFNLPGATAGTEMSNLQTKCIF